MRRLTIKHSAIAYILNREMGYTQNAIAKLMGVSQGTVSNMIKEFELPNQKLETYKKIWMTQGLSLKSKTFCHRMRTIFASKEAAER